MQSPPLLKFDADWKFIAVAISKLLMRRHLRSGCITVFLLLFILTKQDT